MGPDIDTPTWRTLYKIGGIAALLAAVLFRRNIGAEVSLFTGVEAIPIRPRIGTPCCRAIRSSAFPSWRFST